MSNSFVTIDMVTREALRVAHESCQFINTTDRQYDDSFARTGAKIGTALRVRKPNQYVRTTGSRVMDVQDQAEATSSISALCCGGWQTCSTPATTWTLPVRPSGCAAM